MTPGCTGKPRRSEGMDEERKKELAEETAKDIFEDAFKDLSYLQQRIRTLVDTVAAEAREEGIEMLVAAMEKDHPAWHLWTTETAERLKEKP